MILVLYDNHTKFGKRMPESYEKLLLPYDNPTIRPPQPVPHPLSFFTNCCVLGQNR
jgi:hypothetical protein